MRDSVSNHERKILSMEFFFFLSRGSPMVIGVKCADQLTTNHIPVMFSKGKNRC